MVVGQLLQAGEQDLVLDLFVNFLAEAALDQFARRLAGPEAGRGYGCSFIISVNFSSRRPSMSPRSTSTRMCFLHGPVSRPW